MATDRIICTAIAEMQCSQCQHRQWVALQVPVTDRLYFLDQRACNAILDARFSLDSMQRFAQQYPCDLCAGQDFEVRDIERRPAYREGDDLHLPVQRLRSSDAS